jgi:hypothetical protein
MTLVELWLDHDNLYCPVTGNHILSSEHFSASPATAFVFPVDGDDFECITHELKLIEEKVNPEGWEDDLEEEDDGSLEYSSRIGRFLKAIEKEPHLLVFKITTSGMACGPVSSTVYVGIDMNFQEE